MRTGEGAKARKQHGKPVSLHPLPFDEALKGLLETEAPSKARRPHRGAGTPIAANDPRSSDKGR
jgi:hypothetical protein